MFKLSVTFSNKIFIVKTFFIESSNEEILSNYSTEEFKNLGDRIKNIEKVYDPCLDLGKIIVIRLDGCSFKSFTSGLNKPFDARLTRSLIKTTENLVDKFNACLGYCQSDEISLIIDSNRKEKPLNEVSMLYSGRVQKLCSIIGSFASVKFNSYIQSEDWSDVPLKTKEKMCGFNAIFDCRAFSVQDKKSAMEVIYWRHHYDCRRNAINCIGFAHFSPKQLHKVSVRKLIEKLRLEENVDIIKNYDSFNIFGCFSKRIMINSFGNNPTTNENVECIRTKVESKSLNMTTNENDMVTLVMSHTWNQINKDIVDQCLVKQPKNENF